MKAVTNSQIPMSALKIRVVMGEPSSGSEGSTTSGSNPTIPYSLNLVPAAVGVSQPVEGLRGSSAGVGGLIDAHPVDLHGLREGGGRVGRSGELPPTATLSRMKKGWSNSQVRPVADAGVCVS